MIFYWKIPIESANYCLEDRFKGDLKKFSEIVNFDNNLTFLTFLNFNKPKNY